MIEIEKIRKTEEYTIRNDKDKIITVIIENGKISLSPWTGKRDQFIFILSSPETVQAIAEMFLEAVKLVKGGQDVSV